MDIQDMGAIGEAVAAVAVLITLIYLALQVKETHKAIVAQTDQSRSDVQQEAFLRASENDELLAIQEKLTWSHQAMTDPIGVAVYDPEKIDDLSSIEQRRLWYNSLSSLIRLDNVAFQYLQGNITDENMEPLIVIMRQVIPFWEKQGITPRPAMRKLLNLK